VDEFRAPVEQDLYCANKGININSAKVYKRMLLKISLFESSKVKEFA
jgi:hypothetical protein